MSGRTIAASILSPSKHRRVEDNGRDSTTVNCGICEHKLRRGFCYCPECSSFMCFICNVWAPNEVNLQHHLDSHASTNKSGMLYSSNSDSVISAALDCVDGSCIVTDVKTSDKDILSPQQLCACVVCGHVNAAEAGVCSNADCSTVLVARNKYGSILRPGDTVVFHRRTTLLPERGVLLVIHAANGVARVRYLDKTYAHERYDEYPTIADVMSEADNDKYSRARRSHGGAGAAG